MNSKEIYPMFSNLDELGQEELDDQSLQTPSNPATPCTPTTPHTPNTPASHSMSDDTDKSTFSMSMDSGIGSPPSFSLQVNQTNQNLHPSCRSVMLSTTTPVTSRSQKAVDHTSKEKHRRERIKDSCDQLRILLPYIRGRKTDMASILEMCVDYLQIINTFMPQSLQDEVVNILSKDPNLVPNRESIFNRKGKEMNDETTSKLKSSAKSRVLGSTNASSTSSVLVPVGKKPQHFSLTPTEPLNNMIDVRSMVEGKGIKRIRRGEIEDETVTEPLPSLEARLDSTVVGHNDLPTFNNYHTTSLHTKNFQDLDEQPSFGRYITNNASSHNDGYNTAQQMFNTYSSNKTLALETETFRPAFSEPTMFHYYPSVLSNSVGPPRLPYTTTEFVSPNSILSDSMYNHSIRLKQETTQTTNSVSGKDETNLPRL